MTSSYLLRPIRSHDEALRDIERRKKQAQPGTLAADERAADTKDLPKKTMLPTDAEALHNKNG